MRRLFVPSLVLLAACVVDLGWVRGEWQSWPHWQTTARSAALLVSLLAWRLRRGRIVWSTVGLCLVAELVGAWAAGPSAVSTGQEVSAASIASWIPALAELGPEFVPRLVLVASILLPLHLLAGAWMAEFWVGGAAGSVRGLALLAEVAAAVTLASSAGWSRVAELAAAAGGSARISDAAGWLAGGWLAGGWLAGDRLAGGIGPVCVPAVALVFSAVGLALAARVQRRREPLDAGILVALVASALALLRVAHFDLYFAAAFAALGVALVDDARHLAFDDGLTGLPARRALEERLRQLGRTYSLAMLDLDHFKRLNDGHGHEVGDQVLRLVASRLAGVGGGGEPFRYGGEEFTIVFAGSTAAEARQHVDALRQDIASRELVVRAPGRSPRRPRKKGAANAAAKGRALAVTVSIGVAERSARHSTPEAVLEAADQALYRSKKAGRNRVTLAR